MPEKPAASREVPTFKRRSVLSAGVASGLALAGVGAFAGAVTAWSRFDVDFRGCSEVWLIVDDDDLQYADTEEWLDDPLYVEVIVESNGEAVCREVEFTEEKKTTIPGQYGDSPIVKFRAGGGEKILAVIKTAFNPDGDGGARKVRFCYVENDHRCANTPNVADWRDADCYREMTEGQYADNTC